MLNRFFGETMRWQALRSLVLDRTPRRLYHDMRRKLVGAAPLTGFEADHPCIFVLSTGRTGTKTVAGLGGLCGHLFSHHEPQPKLFLLSRMAYEVADEAEAQPLLAAAFQTARADHFAYAWQCRRGYLESSPQATFLAPTIRQVVPSARFIHLIRDPRAVVRSGMRRSWYAGHQRDSNRITPRPDSAEAAVWADFTPFQKNLWLWAETNRFIQRFGQTLPADAFLQLRSEQLFAAEEAALAAFYRFIGAAAPPPRHKIERVLGQQLNAQRTGQFRPAAEWSAAMQADLAAIAGNVAEQFGYGLGQVIE